MDCTTIMAVVIEKRSNKAPDVQKVLTDYGCIINARIGLHQTRNCREEGLVILHLCGSDKEINELEERLHQVQGVRTKKIDIGPDN